MNPIKNQADCGQVKINLKQSKKSFNNSSDAAGLLQQLPFSSIKSEPPEKSPSNFQSKKCLTATRAGWTVNLVDGPLQLTITSKLLGLAKARTMNISRTQMTV